LSGRNVHRFSSQPFDDFFKKFLNP
jgi:hypothetical protein